MPPTSPTRLVALALALTGCTCGAAPTPHTRAETATPAVDPAPAAPELDPSSCAPGVGALPAGVQRGMSVAHNWQHGGVRGYGTSTSRATLEELRDLGVGWVSLTSFGVMRSVRDPEVRIPTRFTETDDRMEREIAAAHELGLRVFLKPHVWIEGGAWRGDVDPGSEEGWARFFETYERWIVHHAELAERTGAELFAVGVEFPTRPEHEAEWRAVIASVRAVYRGELVFAANWDAVERVPFWDAVDHVGVQLYPSLAPEVGADEPTLRAALDGRLDTLEAIARDADRGLVFTEVGYKSIVGCEVHPFTWPERHGHPEPSQRAQARAYRRLFQALEGRDRVRGVYLWKWFTDPNTDEEGADGFSVRGKQAEAVVRSAYGGECPE